jgi:integrase
MVRTVEARGVLDVSRRIKQHVSQSYRFAIPQGWADQDPAAPITDLLKPKRRVRHMPRVGVRELPELIQAIDHYDGEENPPAPGDHPRSHVVYAADLGAHQRDAACDLGRV